MKQEARARILVGVPMGPNPDSRFIQSLPLFLKSCLPHYDMELVQVSNKPLVDAQNYITDYFLNNTHHTHLLFLEDDHWGHTRPMLQALLRADTPICGINYYSRWFPYYSCLMREIYRTIPTQRFAGQNFKEGYHECDLIGFGMTLIKREVFSKLTKPYFEINTHGGKDTYATDINFCDRLRSAGIPLIGCFDYTLNHRDVTPETISKLRIEGFKSNRKEYLKEKGYYELITRHDTVNV